MLRDLRYSLEKTLDYTRDKNTSRNFVKCREEQDTEESREYYSPATKDDTFVRGHTCHVIKAQSQRCY